MKKPEPFTVAEEREIAVLIGKGKSASAARQYVLEDRLRRRPASIRAEG